MRTRKRTRIPKKPERECERESERESRRNPNADAYANANAIHLTPPEGEVFTPLKGRPCLMAGLEKSF